MQVMEDTDKFIDWYIKYIYTRNLVPAPIDYVVKKWEWACAWVDKKQPDYKEKYPDSRLNYIAHIIQKAWRESNFEDYAIEYGEIYTHLKEKFRTYFQ